MPRKTLQFPEGVVDCINATSDRGTILCAGDSKAANGMAIGWINIGHIWGRNGCAVLVRPTRHTFKFMESGDSFTVNVLSEKLQAAVDLFGEKSGRDMDKFAAAKLTKVKGESVAAPYIKEADLVIECRIAFKQPMNPSLICADFVRECYAAGDYHTVYYGEILRIHGK